MPLLWLSAAFLAGILLASWVVFPWGGWAGLALLAGAAGCLELHLPALAGWRLFRRRFAPLPAGFLLAAVLLGSARYQASRPVFGPDDLAFYNGQGEVRFSAVVIESPRRLDHSLQLRLRFEELLEVNGAAAPQPAGGLVLAVLPVDSDYRYGDRLELAGRLEDPPEDEFFSYRAYLARQGVFSYTAYPRLRRTGQDAGSIFYTAVFSLRERAYRVVNRLFPQPEASLLAGILLGMEDDIPARLEDAFRDTGTAHIIAISGFNIAILAALFSSMAGRLVRDRWLSLLAAVLGVTFYTLLVGAGAAVVRAAIMGSLGLLGTHIGRRRAGSNALFFTGAVMCAFNPNLPWDASFQLSFSATLGLVWFGVPLEKFSRGWLAARFSSAIARRIAGPLNEYCLLTLAAQVTTLPIILYHFQRLSLSSLLANPLVLPPQPLVMVLGGLAVLAGMLLYPLGKVLSLAAWPFLAYTIRTTEALASLRGSALVVGEIRPAWVAIYYLTLFLLARNAALLWQQRTRIRPAAGLALLGLGGLIAWRGVYQAPDGLLHLTALVSLPNPSIQIQTPEGRFLLIENSAPTRELNSALARRMPIFHQRLDGLLLPGSKAGVLEGLPDFLERYPPGWVLWNESSSESRAAERLQNWTLAGGIPLLGLETGQSILLGRGARIEVLAAGQETLIGLSWNGLRAVFVNGGDPAGLAELSPSWWPVRGSVLVLSDVDLSEHPPQDWLELQPALVIAPAGGPGLPSHWLALDRHGEVEVTSDGSRIWVSAEK